MDYAVTDAVQAEAGSGAAPSRSALAARAYRARKKAEQQEMIVENGRLRAENAELRAYAERLEGRVDQLVASIKTHIAGDDFAAENAEMRAQLAEAQGLNADLNRRLAEEQGRNANLSREFAELREFADFMMWGGLPPPQ